MELLWRRIGTARRRLPASVDAHHLAWCAICFAPVIFALLTWDPAGVRSPGQSLMRFLGIPVLAVELVVIVLAMRSGFRPLTIVGVAPRWMQSAGLALLLVVLSTVFLVALSPAYAIIRTVMWLIHLLFGMAAAYLLSSGAPDVRRTIWQWTVVGLCCYLGVLAVFVSSISDPQGFEWPYFGLGVVNVRQLGFYSAVGAAAALGLAAGSRHTTPYVLSTVAASLMMALSFWSGTRSSLVAVSIALALGLCLVPTLRTLRVLAAAAASMVLGAALSLIHQAPNSLYGLLRLSRTVEAASADELASGRFELWSGTWNKILVRPMFGYGDSPFPRIVPEAGGVFNHPHNIVLQILFQWGFVGAAWFFAIGAVLCWRALCAARTDGAELAPAFLVAASLLIMSFYEGSFYHPYPVMMIAFAMACLLTAGELRNKEKAAGLNGL